MMPRMVRMANPIISSPPIVLALALKSDVVGCFVDWVTAAPVDTEDDDGDEVLEDCS